MAALLAPTAAKRTYANNISCLSVARFAMNENTAVCMVVVRVLESSNQFGATNTARLSI